MASVHLLPTSDGELPLHLVGAPPGSGVPAVLVVPSIFGPAADLLERLAALGDAATVVVPDPFWRTSEGPVPYDDLDGAIARLADFDPAACGREMAAAAAWARAGSTGGVVGVGICFGGPHVVRLAAAGLLDGVVTWHGSRMEQSLDRAGSITCPVHHHFGSADPVTPPEAIDAISAAFAASPDLRVVVHEGATHGFSHDGAAYDADAAAAGMASVVELVAGVAGSGS